MTQQETFWSGWRERLSALRNVPPVLKIVWESGPSVVRHLHFVVLPLAVTAQSCLGASKAEPAQSAPASKVTVTR